MMDLTGLYRLVVESIRSPQAYDMEAVAIDLRKRAAAARQRLEQTIRKLSAAGADNADLAAVLDDCVLASQLGLAAEIAAAAAPEPRKGERRPSTALH